MQNLGSKAKMLIALEYLKHPSAHGALARAARLEQAAAKALSIQLRRNGYMAFASSHLKNAMAALATKGKLSVVQIGANDGMEGDPVRGLFHAYARKALLVEPIPELMDKLRSSYGKFSGELVIENIAIGGGGDVFSLHRLKPEHWSSYIDKVGRHPSAISSFDRATVREKVAQRLALSDALADSAVECLSCPMMGLSEVIEKHGFEDVDVLQIDCEGFDFKVIESIGPYRPAVINFESFNLSPADWSAWKSWAHENDYGFIQGRMDTLAIRGSRSCYEF